MHNNKKKLLALSKLPSSSNSATCGVKINIFNKVRKSGYSPRITNIYITQGNGEAIWHLKDSYSIITDVALKRNSFISPSRNYVNWIQKKPPTPTKGTIIVAYILSLGEIGHWGVWNVWINEYSRHNKETKLHGRKCQLKKELIGICATKPIILLQISISE